MQIQMQQKDKTLTVSLIGRLDTMTSPELEEQLEPALAGLETLIFDLSGLEYISSAGLRVLLTCYKLMQEQGEMTVRNVNETVMEVFEITGFTDIFRIE